MSDEELKRMNKRDNGCLIVVGIVLGFLVLASLFNPKKKLADVRVMGEVKESIFTGSSFEVDVWHQHPGDLRNGELRVWIMGQNVPEGKPTRIYSFERWSPNWENAVTVSCPVPNYDPAEPLTITVSVHAANVRDTVGRFVWQDGQWNE